LVNKLASPVRLPFRDPGSVANRRWLALIPADARATRATGSRLGNRPSTRTNQCRRIPPTKGLAQRQTYMLNRGETGCIQPPCDEAISVKDGFTRLPSFAVKRDIHLLGEEG